MSDWCTIESDPGVFTELIREIGVKNVQVEEMFEIDNLQNNTENLNPIYGMIFLFKWKQTLEFYDQDLFFANQVIQNACATQAILSILLNNNGIEIGDELTNLKQFTKELDPQLKGLTIGNSEKIRQAHNSFNRPEPFIFSKEKPKNDKGQDVYHFVSYIPFKGKLYELDGLQKGPIMLGEIGENNWLTQVEQEVKSRIQQFGDNETMFNLLAICEDISSKSQKKIDQLRQQIQNETDQEKVNKINIEIIQLESIVQEEQNKRKNHQIENKRRKHNYIPLILNLLETAAKKGKLEDLVNKATQQNKK